MGSEIQLTNLRDYTAKITKKTIRARQSIMKPTLVGFLTFLGISGAEQSPFWQFNNPERFVAWAEEAIPQIKEKLSYDQIELHNLANVVYTDIHGAKGLKIGKKWLIQAIYVNPEQKFKFYCLIHKTRSSKVKSMEETKVSCEQYRF